MFGNDGSKLLKRIAVLVLCAFISIAYMPGVAYALEGEKAVSNAGQVEEPVEGGNADSGTAVTSETGSEEGTGEEPVVEDEKEEAVEENLPAEEDPVVKEDPVGIEEKNGDVETSVEGDEADGGAKGLGDPVRAGDYPQLQPDTDYSIDCSEGEVWYTFTPEEDDTYVIYSSDYEGDPEFLSIRAILKILLIVITTMTEVKTITSG